MMRPIVLVTVNLNLGLDIILSSPNLRRSIVLMIMYLALARKYRPIVYVL